MMTAGKLIERLSLTVFCRGEDREIKAGYCGDLLSWVMGRAPRECAWITVMTNQNVAAVAVLCDAACIILSDGASPDEQLRKRAQNEGLTVLGSELSSFELAVKIAPLLAEK